MRVLVTIAALLGSAVLIAWTFIDPYDRHSILMGLIILAIGGAVFFAALLAFRTRKSTATITTATVMLAVSAVWEVSAPSYSRLEELADPTIRALSDYYDEHGQYPESLDVIEAAPPSTRFGEYRYQPEEEGKRFTLAIGDYGLDLFVGFYVSSDNRWHWDT